MTVFEAIAPVLAGALTKRGYTELTPVQTAIAGAAQTRADLLVSAQTGSGKTVAFGLAMAPELLAGSERVQRASDPLVVAEPPTRELALQVRRELEWLYEPAGATIVSCVGGMDMRQERRTLADGAHIVVGTPGRLGDHYGAAPLKCRRCGRWFRRSRRNARSGFQGRPRIHSRGRPSRTRTLMFSATMPKPIGSLAKRFQRDAIRISMIPENKQHADIEYRTVTVGGAERENAVINVLRYFEAASALVFCSTRERCEPSLQPGVTAVLPPLRFPASLARPSARAPSSRCAMAGPGFALRRTWPRAASICPISIWSFMPTSQRTAKPCCIAAAAPGGLGEAA